MRARLPKWAVVVFLGVVIGVSAVFGFRALIRWRTALPREVTFVGGQPGGRFVVLMGNLAKEVERKHRVRVQVIPAAGSLESLVYLEKGEAHFGLYQSGSLELLEDLDREFLNELDIPSRSGDSKDAKEISFVANLDTQAVNLIVRRDAGIHSPADLRGKTVNLGVMRGGTYAMSLVLLKHFGLTKDSVRAKYLTYRDVREAFLEGSLDAAITTVGIQSPTFREVFETGRCSLLSIPHAEALARNYVGMRQLKVPAGFYRSHPPAEPAMDVQTVALRVQLLTRRDVSERLVEEVTRIALSEEFMKKNSLAELFAGGHRFAREVSDFAIHPGALRYYEPEPHPLLPPDFVQATEGIRSFLFSIALSAYFVYRWLKRKREHRLDKYIKRLLAIEQEQSCADTQEKQLVLASQPIVNPEEALLGLLERIDSLKQEAFRFFTAHEINEELAISCFVQMCDGLTDKINAKLSRVRLHRRFDELSAFSDRGERPLSR